MTKQKEWEAKCKQCGLCCVHKIRYLDGWGLDNTCCAYLDTITMKCTVYKDRKKYKHDCVQFNPVNVKFIEWLPKGCGYR